MFVGLLAGNVRSSPGLAAAVVAGVIAVVTVPWFGRWSVMIAAVAGASAGVVFGQWTDKSS